MLLPQSTTDDATKLAPLTVRVNAAPPAVALFGDSEEMVGGLTVPPLLEPLLEPPLLLLLLLPPPLELPPLELPLGSPPPPPQPASPRPITIMPRMKRIHVLPLLKVQGYRPGSLAPVPGIAITDTAAAI